MSASTMRRLGVPMTVAAALLAACVPVTVNVNFPQERIESAAGQLEDVTRSPDNPEPGRREPASGRSVAVDPELAITPEFVKQIEKERTARRARREAIRAEKERGCVGESNQGQLAVRPGAACSDQVASLVKAENADRDSIIKKFMRHFKMPASDAPRVGAAFAKRRIERWARPGDWVQRPDGQWVQR
ncbi:MAG: DUF1318 domain-containing protein [Candidatus Rokuibacteriota bacterium]